MSHPSEENFQNASFCDIFAADETGVAGDSSPDSTSGNDFVNENEDFRNSPVLEPQNRSPLFKTPISRCAIWKRKLSCSDFALDCMKDDVIHCPLSSTPVPSCSRLEKESPGLNLIFTTEETFGTISSLVDKKDVSWTSSMATPVHDAQSTSFNTEEKKLLMPSENISEHSSAPLCSANRVLFSEEADNNWCETLNLTPKDSDQKTSRMSPVLGGKSDGSYWYWADSQKLVCRTPRRKSSLRRGEKPQLKLPSRKSQLSECKKLEDFLFDTNFSQESIFKSSNDVDEQLEVHNGERCEKEKANNIQILESPLMIRNNSANNLVKKHTPSVTQQFSHDLSASMLEEVCLATEIMSSVKNCDDIQDVLHNDSFSAVKKCSEIKNNEFRKVDEHYIQESNFRDTASITSQAGRAIDFLCEDLQTRNSVSEEKESKENLNVNDSSSLVVSLQKYRITNRCNSVLYSTTSRQTLDESVNGSALYEKIMRAALILEEGEKVRSNLKTNIKEMLGPESLPEEFVAFSVLKAEKETETTPGEKNLSLTLAEVVEDRIHKHNEKDNLCISSEQFKDSKCFPCCSPEVSSVCDKMSTSGVVNAITNNIFQIHTRKSVREGSRDTMCIKSNDYVLKNENGNEQSCGTMKTERLKNMLHMEESKMYPNLKSEETEDLDLLMKLLDNGMNSCTESNFNIEHEKVENKLEDEIIENSSKLEEEAELQLSQDVFEDCDALGSLANNHTNFVTPGFQEVVQKEFSKNLHSSEYWPCFSGELPDEMFENRENDRKYQDSETQITVENKEDVSPPINNVGNEKECVPIHEIEKKTLASGDFSESVNTFFEDSVKRAQEFSTENEKSNIFVQENLNMKDAKEVECDISLSMKQELLEDAFPQISVFPSESREPFSINHKLHSPIDQSSNHEKSKSREIQMKLNEDMTPGLMGFSTASGKRISVSEQAMKKAHKLLEDCDDSVTAFQEISFNDVKNNLPVPENILEKSWASPVKFENQGILKERNKITVDSEKTQRPKEKRLRNCDDSTSKNAFNVEKCSSLIDGKSQSLEVTQEEFCGFKKPLSGTVNISKESSIKAQKILEICEATSQCTKIQEVPAKEENVLAQESCAKANGMILGLPDLMCQGFTTGQGKKISVSKKAVKMAQRMFEECCENSRSSDFQDFASIKSKKYEVSESSEQDTTVEGSTVASGHGFGGFSTANEKNITVSEESLRKVQTIFEESGECTEVEDLLLESNNVGRSENFHTKSAHQRMSLLSYDHSLQCPQTSSNASGKNEAESVNTTKRNTLEESDKKSVKSLVSEDIFTVKNEVALLNYPKRPNKSLERCNIQPEFSEFSTASGKKVNLSEESLRKGQKLFEECKETTEAQEFLTASNNVSDIVNHQNSPIHQQPQKHSPTGVELTRNPDEKSVSLKKKTMPNSEEKVRDHEEVSVDLKAFQNISSDHNKFLNADHSHNGQSTKSLGRCSLKFSTSRNMKSVAEESLKKAQTLFEDFEEYTEFQNCFPTHDNTSGLNNYEIMADGTSGKATLQPEFKGFATAGGKNIAFSKESLEKAKKLFEECEVHSEIQELLPTNNALTTNNSIMKNEGPDFFAANEKKSINKASPKKALKPKNQEVHNEIEDSYLARNGKTESFIQVKSNESLQSDFSVHTELKGFSTAGGKYISISEQSLKKVQKIFEECEQLPQDKEFFRDNNDPGPNVPKKMSGVSLQEYDTTRQPTRSVFSTASGKKVTVSEEAVKEAQKLLSEENISKEPSTDPDVLNQRRAASFPPHIKSKKSLGGRTTHRRQEVHGLFSTSGKAVAISEESLEKVCRDCGGTPDPMKPTECSVSNRVPMKRPLESPEDSAMALEFIVSCSSNVKNVPHSEGRQAKARKLLDETITSRTSADLQDNSPCKKENSASESALKYLHEFSSSHVFKGFSTASGKKVNISEESMKKAQKIFQKCEESATSSNLPDPSEIPVSVKGFASGKGKKISVSEESQKAQKMFEKCEGTASSTSNFPDLPEIHVSVKGFVSAKGKKISVSEESLKKAQKMFQECEEGASSFNLSDPSEISVGVKGFASAKGKKIPVSEESLKKAQKMFEECDEDATSFKIAQTPEVSVGVDKGTAIKPLKTRRELKLSTDLAFKGFSTASGKKVIISEESLKKAQKLFEEPEDSTPLDLPESSVIPIDIDHLPTVKSCEVSCKLMEHESTLPAFKGFSTASGKKVNISEESLKKAQKLFEEPEDSTPLDLPESSVIPIDIDHLPTVKSCEVSCKLMEHESTLPAFKGFSTASGKKVNISEESLKKAQKLFEEAEDSTPLNLPETSEIPFGIGNVPTVKPEKKPCTFMGHNSIDQAFKGFSTASGNIVNISEDALKKVQNFFEECDVALPFDLSESSEIISEVHNMPVTISSKSVGQNSTDSAFKEFSVASAKNACVSEEKLIKLTNVPEERVDSFVDRVRFEDSFANSDRPTIVANNSEEVKTPHTFSRVPIFEGFSTASGKNVAVSEEAVKTAQKLLEECADTNASFELPEFSSDRKKRTASTKTLLANKTTPLQEERSFTASKTNITSEQNLSVRRASAQELNSYVDTPMRSRVDRAVCTKRTFDSSQPAKKFREDVSFGETPGGKLSLVEDLDSAKQRGSDKESAVAAQPEAGPSGQADGATSTSGARRPAPAPRRPESCLRHEKQLLDASDADIDDICRDFLDNSFCARLSGVAAAAAGAGTGVSRKLSFAGAADAPSAQPDDQLSQEVRECMSALLADEAGAGSGAGGRGGGRAPAWARSLLSCPDMVHDRSPAPAPLLSAADPDDALHPDGPASPVLGRTDRFARRPRRALRRRVRKTASALDDSGSVCSSPADSLSGTPQPSPSPALSATTPLAAAAAPAPVAAPKAPASSFKVPYKTLTTPTGAPASASSTPISAPSSCKRPTGGSPCYGTPFLRRPGGARARPVPVQPPPPPPPAEAVASGRARAAAAQAAAVTAARGAAAAVGGGAGARPCQGSLLLRKRTERGARLTWRAAAHGRHPARLPHRTLLRYGMKECVINVTSDNSPHFKFLAWEFYSPKLSAENVDGIPVGDGAMLILDAESKAGVVEVTRAFLASPGVQPSLVPEGWVENHFRWLVWKLATTERSFPQLFAGRCLTPNVLLLQLKYRYDRELDSCERPALRRILEKDDAPGKRLILCVAAVLPVQPGTQNKNESDSPATVASVDERLSSDCELLLTDGWYSVIGAVDREMCRLVRSGRVAVGTKLITHGAELVNCDEGCSPLEAPSAVRLKLHTNSTRRACWDARLGFQNCTGPFPVQLNSVLPNGGLVGCVRVLISRVYPVMYLEKLSNGKSVARTERAEMRVAAQFEQQRQLKLEQLYSQERAKFSQERRGKRRVSIRELAQVTSGHELCELLDSDPDPSSLQSLLTEEQQNAVREFQQGYRDQLTRELQSRIQQQLGEENSTSRNVVCVLKIRCLDAKTRSSSKTAILSVWRPSEEAVNLLKEGCMVKLYSVTAHGTRMGSLQLSTGRQTRYCPVPLPRLVPYFQRRVSSFDEILSPNFQPPFNEMDTVGFIVHVGSGPQSSHFETVYLADADMRIIGVSFWGGMKEFGWEDLLRPNSFVAASNLQWRQNSIAQRVICTYASEFSTFTKSPKQILLKEALDDLKYNIQMDLKQFSSACKELIFSHINGKIFGDTSCNQKEKQVTPQSAMSHSAVLEIPEEDLQETPVRKKLRKLEQYANPPPISPVFIPSPGLSLKKQFHVPSKNPPCGSSNILYKPVVENVENNESPPLSLDEPG